MKNSVQLKECLNSLKRKLFGLWTLVWHWMKLERVQMIDFCFSMGSEHYGVSVSIWPRVLNHVLWRLQVYLQIFAEVRITVRGNTGHAVHFIKNTAAEKSRKIINAFLDLRDTEERKLGVGPEAATNLGKVTTVNFTMCQVFNDKLLLRLIHNSLINQI